MTDKTLIQRGSSNVFDDLGFDVAEARNLQMRAVLMGAIADWFAAAGLTQQAAAKRLGVTQPRFNAVLKGEIGACSLDWLVNVAAAAGLPVKLSVGRPRKHA